MVAALIAGALTSFLALAGDSVGVNLPPPPLVKAVGPVAGERYAWRTVKVGGGGFITGLSFDDAGKTMVARADVHGAYLWDAAKDRWINLVTAAGFASSRMQAGMNQGAFEIAVAPSDGNRLYLAIKGRVYRSTDRGVNWASSADGTPFPFTFDANGEFRLYGPFIAVDPENPDILFFGSPENGLWRSTDGAQHWTSVASVPKAADLRPDPGVQAPGIPVWFGPRLAGRRAVYAAPAGHGVYVAPDAGADFAPLTAKGGGPKTVTRAAMTADGVLFATEQEARAVWALRDGQWQNLTTRGLHPTDFVGVAARDRQVLVSNYGGDMWCSADAGATWAAIGRSQRVGAGDPPWLRINDGGYFASGQIAVDPVKPDTLWVAGGAGPYVAHRQPGCFWPIAWSTQARGIEELVATDAVQPPGRAPMFAALDFGIHVKTDLDAYSTTFGPRERALIAAQQVAWTPANPDFAVTNASDTRTGCCAQDGQSVLAGYTMNAGRTWSRFATLPTPPGTQQADPWHMAFGTIAVSADDIRNIVWAPGYNRAPYVTTDLGASWRRVSFPGEHLPNTGSFPNIWVNRKTLAADRVRPGTFYLVHSGEAPNASLQGLWRTTDRGATWTRVFAGEIAPDSNQTAKLRAVPGKAGHLFFTSAAGYGADTRLRRSRDGGVTWQALDGVDHVDDVAFGKAAAGAAYPAIYLSGQIGGAYGIWRSTDDAASWQRVAGFPMGRLDQVTVIEADKDVFGRVYVGYLGSGWLYGAPAACTARAFAADDEQDCEAVAAAVVR